MQLQTKAQIAGATLSLLTVVASLFFLGVLVIVLCAGLQINPFRETTTSFLVAAFVGLTGVAAVLVLLNVATNVSLIADAKIAELRIEPRRGVLRKWLAAFVLAAVALSGLVFGGTYLSKERYLGIVRTQSDEVAKRKPKSPGRGESTIGLWFDGDREEGPLFLPLGQPQFVFLVVNP